MPKLKVTLSIGYSGATHEDILEIEDDEWADCKTDEEREKLIGDYWGDWANNYIDGSAVIVD